MATTPEFTDFLGNEIKVGSKIVYATSNSNSARLTLGEVLEVGPDLNQHSYYDVRIKVQPLKDSNGDYRFKEFIYRAAGDSEFVDREARTVILHFTNKLLVLS